MSSLVPDIARFVVETKFEDLPEAVVHEAKRVLLDSIGCALAGIGTDKGKISVQLARKLGGPEESSIIGLGGKVSSCAASFANAELLNAMDWDPLLLGGCPHATPYVLPASLAVAEKVEASGKDLILAIVLSEEIAARIRRAWPGQMEFVKEGPAMGSVRWSPTFGHGHCIFGATAGAGKLLEMDQGKLSHALGIAGHFCPVPAGQKFLETPPAAMAKYGPAGWISMGAVTTALLAEMGYVGDTTVFDGEYGFWRFYAAQGWNPDVITDRIGKTWQFLDVTYKLYPSCGCMHGGLDLLMDIIEENDLAPEEIESVTVFCHPLVERPIWQNTELVTQIDAQFSTAYVFAVAAHRVKLNEWQDWDTMRNPKILEFMKKVDCCAHPEFEAALLKDPRSRPAKIEVMARGRTFKAATQYMKGLPVGSYKLTDEELVRKFERNASKILTQDHIDGSVKSLLNLENVTTPDLMKQVTS